MSSMMRIADQPWSSLTCREGRARVAPQAATEEAAMSAALFSVPNRDPQDEPTPAPKTVEAPARAVKELRLGLLCYGESCPAIASCLPF